MIEQSEIKTFTKKQIADTAKMLGSYGHICASDDEFAENISEYIEHPERIVPPTTLIKGKGGFPDMIVGNPNTYLHLAIPKHQHKTMKRNKNTFHLLKLYPMDQKMILFCGVMAFLSHLIGFAGLWMMILYIGFVFVVIGKWWFPDDHR